MKARRKIAIGLACALVLGGIIWALKPPPEPSFGGQTLTYWLDNYLPQTTISGAYGIVFPNSQAEEAIRQIGTNALPSLLRMADAHDSPLKLKLVALARKQHVIPIRFSFAFVDNRRAAFGFSVLGSAGSNAVPNLITIFNTGSPVSREVTAKALGSIGPAARQAVPSLCSGLGAKSGISLRRACVQALGQIHAEPEQSLPALIKSLDDQALRGIVIDAIGRFEAHAEPAVPVLTQICDLRTGEASHAATALGLIGPAAKEAVPSLLRGLADTSLDVEFRLQCVLALGRIHSDPGLVVPLLMKSISDTMNDTDVRIRAFSATALGRFGTGARQATPLLTRLLQDPNRNVRLEVTNALHLIGSGALEKADDP